MFRTKLFGAALALCLFVLSGAVGAAYAVGGVNRYDAFPGAWKFAFSGSSKITVGYGGSVCGSQDKDQYHTGTEYHALDWSRLSGDGDIGDPILAPASGWATAYFGSTGYGNYIRVEAGNGYSYLIAHLNTIELNYCGWIERGQRLGTLGCSGNCTGAHIHFVVYLNGNSVAQKGISGQQVLELCKTYSSGQ